MLLELDGDGRPQRHAFLAEATGERPVVDDAAGGEVTLAWPGRDLPRRAASWAAVPPRSEP
jgi:hypothetical protein